MATRSKKFLFDRSFDDPNKLYLPGERRRAEAEAAAVAEAAIAAADGATAEMPAEPEVSPEELLKARLDAAREEGYVNGHTAALEEAGTAREHYTADAINLISQGLDKLGEQQREAYGQIADDALRMVYAVVQKLLPPIAQTHASETIGEFVRQILPIAAGEPRLVVRTHTMIVEDLDRRLQDVIGRSNFRGTFQVVPDYELQPGDARIEWDSGGAERNEARIWRDIRAAIATTLGDVDIAALEEAAAKDEGEAPEMADEEPAQA